MFLKTKIKYIFMIKIKKISSNNSILGYIIECRFRITTGCVGRLKVLECFANKSDVAERSAIHSNH